MRTRKLYVTAGLVAVAFLLLGGIQSYWFGQSFNSEQRQLNRSINLALRQTGDLALKMVGDSSTVIPPVAQRTDGSFDLDFQAPLDYPTVDSLLQASLATFQIDLPYQMTLNDCFTGEILLGHYLQPGSDIPSTCSTRDNDPNCIALNVHFSDSFLYTAGRMKIWLLTSFFLLVLLGFFASTLLSLFQTKRLERIKTDLIQNLTHELKTPVTNIGIASEALVKRGKELGPDRAGQYAGIIQKENLRLQGQIEQLLEMAVLEQDKIPLEMERLNLHDLLQKASKEMAFRIEERGGQLISSLKASSPFILGDANHLMQAIRNLLDNAEKYSPINPTIQLTTKDNAKEVVLIVEDQGIGMDAEVKGSIFTKFYRAPEAGHQHAVKGFGIGLSYVQSVLRKHQGRIQVKSVPGKGSRFELFFPLAVQ